MLPFWHNWKMMTGTFDLILYIQSTLFQLCRDGSSWVEPELSKDKRVLLKDTTQWQQWGSNPRRLGLVQALHHWATVLLDWDV